MATQGVWHVEEAQRNGRIQEIIVISDSPTPPPDHSPNAKAFVPSEAPIVIDDTPTPPPEVSAARKRHDIGSSDGYTETLAKRRKITDNKASRSVMAPTLPCNDKDGHYIVRPNESLTARYKILRLLGQGTFGKVVECYDRVRRTYCAIKIIRAVPKYRDASKVEIRVLNALKEHDPLNTNQCIHLVEWFDYRNHICMVFELFDRSVYDFLKMNSFRPFPAEHIQQFAKQLLVSVAFLHDLKLIHTDLKPENILLVSHASSIESDLSDASPDQYPPEPSRRVLQDTSIRLIDFGSAIFEKDFHAKVVSTRHYRAPEIILDMGWSYPCDMWSLGCILVEFHTGEALFQTHENLEHLAMMEQILGPIPQQLKSKASSEARAFFAHNGRLKYPDNKTTNQSMTFVQRLQTLQNIVKPTTRFSAYLLDLLKGMLTYKPQDRITAREALRHPFFNLASHEFNEPVS